MMNIRQEEFSSIDTGMIQINVAYPSAAAQKVEQALENVENIDTMTSTAREGACAANLQIDPSADLNRVLNEVKSSVDGVIGFPADIEKPIVAAFSPSSTVMSPALTANTASASLKELA